MPTPLSIAPAVANSGTSLLIKFLDENGNPTHLNSYNENASQILKIVAGDGMFTVTFNGQTTEALPVGIKGS
jgi:hypothetical protein